MQLESPTLTQKCSTMTPGNPVYFGVKRSKFKATSHKNIADVGLLCTLVSAGFFYVRIFLRCK